MTPNRWWAATLVALALGGAALADAKPQAGGTTCPSCPKASAQPASCAKVEVKCGSCCCEDKASAGKCCAETAACPAPCGKPKAAAVKAAAASEAKCECKAGECKCCSKCCGAAAKKVAAPLPAPLPLLPPAYVGAVAAPVPAPPVAVRVIATPSVPTTSATCCPAKVQYVATGPGGLFCVKTLDTGSVHGITFAACAPAVKPCVVRAVGDTSGKVEVCFGCGSVMTCENLSLKVADAQGLKILATGKQVAVHTCCIDAVADSVIGLSQGDTIVFKGNVKLKWNKGGQRVEATGEQIAVGLKDGSIKIEGAASVR
jgi:hypothetical protein